MPALCRNLLFLVSDLAIQHKLTIIQRIVLGDGRVDVALPQRAGCAGFGHPQEEVVLKL